MPKRGNDRLAVCIALIERDGGACPICLQAISLAEAHIDHLVPRSAGGGDDLDNLQAVHKPCNSRKGVNAFVRPDGSIPFPYVTFARAVGMLDTYTGKLEAMARRNQITCLMGVGPKPSRWVPLRGN